jgi:hypothetical protein
VFRRISGALREDVVKTRLILKPGQRGTKRLAEQYGDALLYVRFRYDAESRQRLKTVELRRLDAASAPLPGCPRPSPHRRGRPAGALTSQSSRRSVGSGKEALVREVRKHRGHHSGKAYTGRCIGIVMNNDKSIYLYIHDRHL